MKQFLITVCGVIVGGVILLILPFLLIGAIASALSSGSSKQVVEDNSVLIYNLESAVADRASEDPMLMVSSIMSTGEAQQSISLGDIKKSLAAAKNDDKIKGIIMKGTSSGASYSSMKEIAPYLSDFKNSGKFIYYFDNNIEQSALYLASMADSVFVMPIGQVMVYGLSSTHMFYKNAFDKFGIDMQVIRHGKYKSAVEPYITDHMSDASREQTKKYLDAIWGDVRKTIATNRNISEESIDAYSNTLNFADIQSAVDNGFIDRAIYRDELISMVKGQLGLADNEDIKSVSISDYCKSVTADQKITDNKLTVIYAQGEINDGSKEGDISNIYGEDLARTIRQARQDDNTKAIVLRVNSPGGSVIASEVIWREVKLASETKPVVVSMGRYAASGGYYISCASNYIFAEPTTITGSIGIFGTIPNIRKAANNIGITFDNVSTNKEVEPSLYEPLSEGWKEYFQKEIESGYQTFITRCANGRHTTTEHIDSIGQGRVWAGTDALEIGLVDELGSLDDAIAYAAKLADLDVESYNIEELPVVDDSFAAMMKRMGVNAKASIGECIYGETYKTVEHIKAIAEKPSIHARMEYDVFVR